MPNKPTKIRTWLNPISQRGNKFASHAAVDVEDHVASLYICDGNRTANLTRYYECQSEAKAAIVFYTKIGQAVSDVINAIENDIDDLPKKKDNYW